MMHGCRRGKARYDLLIRRYTIPRIAEWYHREEQCGLRGGGGVYGHSGLDAATGLGSPDYKRLLEAFMALR
jgi:hypothetical protein